jgi:uncharacterized protein YhdP
LVHGTVRGLFKLLGAVAMLALVLSAWAAHRLSQGPMSLSDLTPYIEQALSNPDANYRVKVADTILSWNRDNHSLEIRAIETRMIAEDGRQLALFPEMSVTLSGHALLRGKLVPRSVRLFHPVLHLVRDESGELSLGIGGGDSEAAAGDSGAIATAGFDALMEPQGKETLTGQLQRIQVTGGSLTIEDRLHGMTWTAPNSDFTFRRDDRGLAVQAALDLDFDGQLGHLVASGVYLTDDHVIDLAVSGGGLKPAILARLSPQLDVLSAVQVPIGGSVKLRYKLGQGVTALEADVAAGEGVLDLTPTEGFALAVKAVRVRVNEQGDHLKLDELRVDLGGPVLTATGSVDGLNSEMKLALQAQIDGVPLDQLSRIWPKTLAPNPRAWVTGNMSKGSIGGVAVTLAGHVPAGHGFGDLSIDTLNGAMTVEDATVRYMPEMPVLQHANASINFDSDAFTIGISGGSAADLAVPEGKVVLSGLSKVQQQADISAHIAGSLTDILRFIDNPPLGYTRKLKIDPAAVKGDGVVDLALHFPLVENISLDLLKVRVEADAKGVFLPKVVQQLDLAEGSLHLSIDNDGMDAEGPAQIDHRPARIKWRENFGDAAPFHSRYQVMGQLSDEGRKLVGLESPPFQPPYLTGVIPAEITAVLTRDGRYDISVHADLRDAVLSTPGLDFTKPAGVTADASADFQVADDKLLNVSRFHVGGKNLDISGDVAFERGEISKVTFTNAAFGRTQASGSLVFRPDGALALTADGSSFDAREIVHSRAVDPATDKMPTTPKAPPQHLHPDPPPEVTPLVIQGRFGRIWLSDEGWISNAAADLVRDQHDWRTIHVSGEVGDHAPVKFDVTPSDATHSALSITGSDAGSAARAMDVFDTMRGGELAITGIYDDKNPARPLAGVARIKNFQLAEAPVLAKLLTVAGLTGIGDLLSGQGIHFNELEMPYTYVDGLLVVNDGQASGSALGITARGKIDLDHDKLGLEGTVVPAYAINSALGSLPLVGGIFSAEKGGGIIGINYQMKGPMSEPDFMVNPLSALTPGFLRNLFHLFDEKQPSGNDPHK